MGREPSGGHCRGITARCWPRSRGGPMTHVSARRSSSHGHAGRLTALVAGCSRRRWTKLVVVAKRAGRLTPAAAEDAPRSSTNESSASRIAANAKPRSRAAKRGDYVLVDEPEAVPDGDAVAILRALNGTTTRAADRRPAVRYPDGRLAGGPRPLRSHSRRDGVRRTQMRALFSRPARIPEKHIQARRAA